MDAYMQIVVALYEENNEVYASLGLTREECQIIIADTISKTGIVWQNDYNEDESDKDSGSMDNQLSKLDKLFKLLCLKKLRRIWYLMSCKKNEHTLDVCRIYHFVQRYLT